MGPLGKDSFSRTEANLVYNDSLSAAAICHNIYLHNDQLGWTTGGPDSLIYYDKAHISKIGSPGFHRNDQIQFQF